MAMLPTNEIVARITGMKRELLADSRENAVSGQAQEESIGGMACPSPVDTIRGRTEQPHEVRRRMYEENTRGDRADFSYDIPKSKARAVDSQKNKAPNHKMPSTDAKDVDGADMDDEQLAVGSKQTEAKRSMSKKFFQECIGSMEEFRRFAGLPMTEMTVAEPRAAHSGDVPTAGVNKQNKMKAGLPGLEGEPLQAIEPKAGPGDEDEVGDAKEMTLDQALAMLKKEGIDTDSLWAEFLEQRGLSTDLFSQLVDEAMEGENAEEIDQLIAVEGLFLQALPKLLPEGLMDMFRRKKEAQPDVMAPVRAATAAIRQHGAAGVRAANARGVDVNKVVPLTQKKAANAPTPVAQANREINTAQSVAGAPPAGGGYQQKFQGTRYQRSVKPTRQMQRGEDREWEMECDDDGAGTPKMPWESNMSGLAGKYLSEGKEKFIQKAIKKPGALHKQMGVPQGKKIPAKKLNAAAEKGGKLGARARLAKTLKKLNK